MSEGVCPRSWPSDGLYQVFIQPQGLGDGAGDLGYLQSVGQAIPVVIPLGSQTPGFCPSGGEMPYSAVSCPCPADIRSGYHIPLPAAPFLWNGDCGKHRDSEAQALSVPWFL